MRILRKFYWICMRLYRNPMVLGFLWHFYEDSFGGSTVCLWYFYGVAMRFLLDFHGGYWNFIRTISISQGCLWDSYRISAGFSWDSYGSPMGFLWSSCGISIVFLLDSYDISMRFLWDSCRNSMLFLLDFYGLSMGLLWGFYWIPLRFPWATLIPNSMIAVWVLYCVQLFSEGKISPKICSPFQCYSFWFLVS